MLLRLPHLAHIDRRTGLRPRARWLLLTAMLLSMLWPQFDPGLGASPTHQHVVVGGTAEQQARALREHLASWGESHRAPTAHRIDLSDPLVVSVSDDGSVLGAPAASTAPSLLTAAALSQRPPLATTSTALDLASAWDDLVATVPTRPPRTASSPLTDA